MPDAMHLKIVLPFATFADLDGVTRLQVQSAGGAFGLLPQRLDCVLALIPGVLSYASAAAGTVYLAVDSGVLVKVGRDVLVSVRHVIGGSDLGGLHALLRREFVALDAREQSRRVLMTKLENDLMRRLADFPHGN